MTGGGSLTARRWLASACGAAALACWSEAAASGGRHFSIAAQPLGPALRAFALASGRDVVFDPALVRGKQARALTGDLTDEAALDHLLKGAGLAWSLTSGGGFVIRPAPPPEPPAAPVMVDELIVTASKRPERAHDVPSSVSAVTGDILAANGARRLQDYAGRIPGLAVLDTSMANGSNQLAIRAITTGVGGNPTVGVYIDDAPYGSSTGFGAFTVPDLDPQDLERVEVLRGPQGTLYGAGSLGGLLKYVTAAPDPLRFSGRMEADVSAAEGGGQGYGLRGAANIPLNDRLAVRLSAYDRDDPGYVDNVLTGEQDLNSGRFYGRRLAIGWQVDDDWKVRLSALYQMQRAQGPNVDYDRFTFEPVYGDLKQRRAVGTNVNEQQTGIYALEIEGRLGGFASLTSSTSYDKQKMYFNIDTSAAFAPLIASLSGVQGAGSAIVTDDGLDKFTQELRLASPADRRLSWRLGAFYTHENDVEAQDTPVFDPLSGTPITGAPVLLDISARNEFEEAALFGDATWRFNPRFDLTSGVRYSHNNQRQISAGEGVLVGGPGNSDTSSSDSSATWLITPRWRLSDAAMLYARYATGYRPGGPNALDTTPGVPASFGPDKVTNYEVGLKSDLLDRRASIELAAYWIDWTDIQIQEVDAVGISYIDNAGSAISRGVEASGAWRPAPGLEIDGALAYNDARLTSTVASGLAVARDGDPLPLSPRWSSNLAVQYDFAIGGGWRAVAAAEWRHVGRTYGSFPNPGLPRFVHPAYDVVNLRAGMSRELWSLDLYLRNIGDSRGQTSDLTFGPTTRVSIIPPRSLGLALARKF